MIWAREKKEIRERDDDLCKRKEREGNRSEIELEKESAWSEQEIERASDWGEYHIERDHSKRVSDWKIASK